MTVRHLRLEGTQQEIGFALTAIGRDRDGITPEVLRSADTADPRRRYLDARYPRFAARMRGVADALEIASESRYDLSGLPYNMLLQGIRPRGLRGLLLVGVDHFGARRAQPKR